MILMYLSSHYDSDDETAREDRDLKAATRKIRVFISDTIFWFNEQAMMCRVE